MHNFTEPTELDILKAKLDDEPYGFFNLTRAQKDNIDVLRYALQYVPSAISDTTAVLNKEEYHPVIKKDGSLLKHLPKCFNKAEFYDDALINGGFAAYKVVDEEAMTPLRYLQVLDGMNAMVLRGVRNFIQSGDYVNAYQSTKTSPTTAQDNVLGTLKMLSLGDAIKEYHPDIHILMMLDLSILELKSNIKLKLNGNLPDIKAEDLPDLNLS